MSAVTEHDRVVLTRDRPAERLAAGDVGTVIHVYRAGKAFEVEFLSLTGQTLVIVTLEAESVRPVSPGEITHARSVA